MYWDIGRHIIGKNGNLANTWYSRVSLWYESRYNVIWVSLRKCQIASDDNILVDQGPGRNGVGKVSCHDVYPYIGVCPRANINIPRCDINIMPHVAYQLRFIHIPATHTTPWHVYIYASWDNNDSFYEGCRRRPGRLSYGHELIDHMTCSFFNPAICLSYATVERGCLSFI